MILRFIAHRTAGCFVRKNSFENTFPRTSFHTSRLPLANGGKWPDIRFHLRCCFVAIWMSAEEIQIDTRSCRGVWSRCTQPPRHPNRPFRLEPRFGIGEDRKSVV